MAMRDRSLLLAEHTIPAKIPPQEVFYQKVQASGSTVDSTNFSVRTPGAGWLLSNEIWISYKMIVTGSTRNAIRDILLENITGAGRNTPNAISVGNLAVNTKFMPRANSPLSRCMSNLVVQVNGSSVTDRPSSIQDAMDRLYLSEEESQCSTSPAAGYFDGPNEFYCFLENGIPEPILCLNTGSGTYQGANASDGISSAWSNQVNNSQERFFRWKGGPCPTPTKAGANNVYHTPIDGNANIEINEGAQKRWNKFQKRMRSNRGDHTAIPAQGAGAFDAADANTVSVVFYERLPSSLFYQYMSRDKLGGMPHVESLNIIIQYHSNLVQAWAQSSLGVTFPRAGATAIGGANNQTNTVGFSHTLAEHLGTAFQFPGTVVAAGASTPDINGFSLVSDPNTNDVSLHLKWVLPPPTVSIPSAIKIPSPSILIHQKDLGEFQRGGAPAASTFDVEFPWTPTMILIYAKVPVGQLRCEDKTEMFGHISNLEITTDGETGKMMAISQAQLYAAWKRNGNKLDKKRFPFEEWREHFCTVALAPGDYGARKPPGSLGRFLLSVKPTIAIKDPYQRGLVTLPINRYGQVAAKAPAQPAARNVRYYLYVVGINDKAYVELSPGGFSRVGFKGEEPVSLQAPGGVTGASSAAAGSGLSGGGNQLGLLNFGF